jgi:hypothetical protein
VGAARGELVFGQGGPVVGVVAFVADDGEVAGKTELAQAFGGP